MHMWVQQHLHLEADKKQEQSKANIGDKSEVWDGERWENVVGETGYTTKRGGS